MHENINFYVFNTFDLQQLTFYVKTLGENLEICEYKHMLLTVKMKQNFSEYSLSLKKKKTVNRSFSLYSYYNNSNLCATVQAPDVLLIYLLCYYSQCTYSPMTERQTACRVQMQTTDSCLYSKPVLHNEQTYTQT